MDAQINTSLRSIKGCLAVFICRTHLIAFIYKVVYRRRNYDFIAFFFLFLHSVRNNGFWSSVCLCSFWTKSYKKFLQVKNVWVCGAKQFLHHDLYGRRPRNSVKNNCLCLLQRRCNRGIKLPQFTVWANSQGRFLLETQIRPFQDVGNSAMKNQVPKI